jgi:PAS domain S-box-containing protein
MKVLHEAESALRESEERYRRLVELSPDAIYVHNGASFIYVNPAGATLLGADGPEALLGGSILDVVYLLRIDTLRDKNLALHRFA